MDHTLSLPLEHSLSQAGVIAPRPVPVAQSAERVWMPKERGDEPPF